MKKIVLPAMALAAVALVSACTSSERFLARDQATCGSIGFATESEEFRNCVLELQSARLQASNLHRYR